MRGNPTIARLALAMAPLALASCYTTGLRFPESVRKVNVQVFGNDSYVRGLEFQMTDEIRQILIDESEVRLVTSSENADAVIRGKILRVDYPVLVGREQSGILEGSASIAVEAELVDARTGRVLAKVGGTDVAEFTAALGENRQTAQTNAIEELSWKVILGLSQRSCEQPLGSGFAAGGDSRPAPR
jgi:hypothetical protein